MKNVSSLSQTGAKIYTCSNRVIGKIDDHYGNASRPSGSAGNSACAYYDEISEFMPSTAYYFLQLRMVRKFLPIHNTVCLYKGQ